MTVFLTIMIMALVVSNVLLWFVVAGLKTMFVTIMNKIAEFAEEDKR